MFCSRFRKYLNKVMNFQYKQIAIFITKMITRKNMILKNHKWTKSKTKNLNICKKNFKRQAKKTKYCSKSFKLCKAIMVSGKSIRVLNSM